MIVPALLLAILGITVIYSSSPTLAVSQAAFSLVGLGLFFLLRMIDFKSLIPLIRPMYIIILVSLIIVFFLGVETRGALRWIPLGPLTFQPSEFAKPVLVLMLSFFWSRNQASWINILKSLGIVALPILLIFKQPDLGTTITIFFIWFILLIASNISFAKALLITLSLGSIAPVIFFLLQSYQRQRLLSFLSPNLDPQGMGYNVIQSTIAIGSGELTGRGLGRGTQSHLQFLPEFRTDFIFASIAEELGMLGTMIVLILYGVIFYFLAVGISKVRDRFGELILVGVSGMLFIQIVVNIGMNSGVLPITGITLPLLSYGGSSILATFILLGLASSVQKYGLKRKDRGIDSFALQ